jgi:hypothetical protein
VIKLTEYALRRRMGNLAVQPPLFELDAEAAAAP